MRISSFKCSSFTAASQLHIYMNKNKKGAYPRPTRNGETEAERLQ